MFPFWGHTSFFSLLYLLNALINNFRCVTQMTNQKYIKDSGNCLGDICADRRKIVTFILKKICIRVLTGINWLRIESGEGVFWRRLSTNLCLCRYYRFLNFLQCSGKKTTFREMDLFPSSGNKRRRQLLCLVHLKELRVSFSRWTNSTVPSETMSPLRCPWWRKQLQFPKRCAPLES
jgi:hypothetical protein